MVESFWPEISTEKIRTPHAILLEQANLLTEKTKGLLVGNVARGQSGRDFVNSLVIVAPPLNNYAFGVLSVVHGISLYPATVVVTSRPNVEPISVSNEQALLDTLKVQLKSTEVAHVITALLSQIQVDEPSALAQKNSNADISGQVTPSGPTRA
jgi:hypothetical protein